MFGAPYAQPCCRDDTCQCRHALARVVLCRLLHCGASMVGIAAQRLSNTRPHHCTVRRGFLFWCKLNGEGWLQRAHPHSVEG